MREPKKLGEILKDLKVLDALELQRVLQVLRCRGDRHKFGQVARDMGLIQDEHIWAALAVQMQLLPGIQKLTLEQILQALQEEVDVDSMPASPPTPA